MQTSERSNISLCASSDVESVVIKHINDDRRWVPNAGCQQEALTQASKQQGLPNRTYSDLMTGCLQLIKTPVFGASDNTLVILRV